MPPPHRYLQYFARNVPLADPPHPFQSLLLPYGRTVSDAVSLPLHKTEPEGERVSSGNYDDLGRLEQTQYPDGTVLRYSYDNVGNRLSQQIVKGLVTLSASPYGPQPVGTSVILTATGKGAGPYEYRLGLEYPGTLRRELFRAGGYAHGRCDRRPGSVPGDAVRTGRFPDRNGYAHGIGLRIPVGRDSSDLRGHDDRGKRTASVPVLAPKGRWGMAGCPGVYIRQQLDMGYDRPGFRGLFRGGRRPRGRPWVRRKFLAAADLSDCVSDRHFRNR